MDTKRYFRIGGVDIMVESPLPFRENSYHSKIRLYQREGPGKDMVRLRYHFTLPKMGEGEFGTEFFRLGSKVIFRKDDSWVYRTHFPGDPCKAYSIAIFNNDHTRGDIYQQDSQGFEKGNLRSLTLFPTDQILFVPVLADREGCYLHSSAVNMDGHGLVFVGHSEAGKSTLVTKLRGHAEILCDDRNIIRRRAGGDYIVHGTWSHGDVPDVSSRPAPLKAVLFLEKAEENSITPLTDRAEIRKRLLACLIKALITKEWWEKELDLITRMSKELDFFILRSDKSREIVSILKNFLSGEK